MKVQILGTGCPKCRKLAEIAESVVKETGARAEVVKISEIDEIVKFGVMSTPALAIDGKIKSSGRLPSREEIKGWLTDGEE